MRASSSSIPKTRTAHLLDERGIRFIKQAVTRDNYRELLTPLLTAGGGQGFCVNLSVDTSSVDIMELCNEIGALYIDTVNEPWPGFYFDAKLGPEARSNYALREATLAAKRARKPGSQTAVSCCGANPGMVSWFVKQALLNIANDTGAKARRAEDARGLGASSCSSSASRASTSPSATPSAPPPKPMQVFVNTWSVEGFVSEGMQPAELGWGTHEKWMPDNGRSHKTGCDAAIYLMQPGANTRVRSWTPTPQAAVRLSRHAQRVDLDRRLLHRARRRQGGCTGRPATTPIIRATRRCCRCTRCSARPACRQPRSTFWTRTRSSTASTSSACCSTATRRTPIGTARSSRSRRPASIAPYQNATGLQVTSAVLAGMVWALENPKAGIVEADEMDFRRCLEVQMPYLGPVIGIYTDWTPLTGRPGLFPEDIDTQRPLAVQERAGALTTMAALELSIALSPNPAELADH